MPYYIFSERPIVTCSRLLSLVLPTYIATTCTGLLLAIKRLNRALIATRFNTCNASTPSVVHIWQLPAIALAKWKFPYSWENGHCFSKHIYATWIQHLQWLIAPPLSSRSCQPFHGHRNWQHTISSFPQ